MTCSHIKFKSKETCSVGTLRVRVIEIETETFGVCTVGVGICNCRRESRLVVKFHVRDASAEALSLSSLRLFSACKLRPEAPQVEGHLNRGRPGLPALIVRYCTVFAQRSTTRQSNPQYSYTTSYIIFTFEWCTYYLWPLNLVL